MAQPLAVLLIAAVAILGFLAAIVRPTATVLPAYAALVPVGDVIAVPLPLPSPFNSLSSLIGAVAIAAMLAHVLVFGRGRVPSLPVAAWLLFAGWCAATVLWARHPADGARELTVALPLVLLVVVVAILPRRDGDLERLRLILVLGGVAVGAYALFLLGTGACGWGVPSLCFLWGSFPTAPPVWGRVGARRSR